MDNPPLNFAAVEADGLSVSIESGCQMASLRYFDVKGSFAAAVSEAAGRALPEALRAVETGDFASDKHFLLAWRSPTETLLLCRDRIMFAELERRLADATDGCMVDQTGGLCVIRSRGRRVRDVLLRLAGAASIPRLGEALSGRYAEVQVLTLCVQEGEFVSLVERVYAAHFLEWIRRTAADLS